MRARVTWWVMLCSGFAGLGMQIAWTQQNALWLGHEAPAVLAVVAAFFGGLALGALALGGRIERSAHPARWYAACEVTIAFWSVASLAFMPRATDALLHALGEQPTPLWQWTITFAGTFALLLPATAAMGATLPAMERLAPRLAGTGRPIAPLYAANTFGAVLGALGCAFWLIPAHGLARTILVCALCNVLCALAALMLARHAAPGTAVAPRVRRPLLGALAPLAVTGLLGVGYEVLVVRVLAQVAEGTVYTFAMLLAIYLVGTASGAAAWQRWFARGSGRARAGERLPGALAAACLVGVASLWSAERVRDLVVDTLGGGMVAGLAAEGMVALFAFALPTALMGALFSHLCVRACDAGATLGQALGANTLAAACAPWLFGVLAFPALGPKVSLLVIAAGYLTLCVPRTWRTPVPWIPAVAVAALAAFAPRLAFIAVPEGGRVVSYEEGVAASVSVVEDAAGVAVLRIDNRQQEGSSATRRVDSRQALLPLLLHPAPRRALFLGLGTGVTARAAALDQALRVEVVELLPEVIRAAAYFRAALAPEPARLTIHQADARRFVRVTRTRYDVIVADNFHPARSGSGALYTVEHFAAVRARLARAGVFCQWLPLHQLDLESLRAIVRAFETVYPHGFALLANYGLDTPVLGLVARADDDRFDAAAVRARLAAAPFDPARFGIEDEFALWGGFVAGPEALRRFAGDADLNTDDHPVVAYRAPRLVYAADSTPADRLSALLDAFEISPEALVANPPPGWSRRLDAYWIARDRFIAAGRAVIPTLDVHAMLAQVRAPLLEVLRASPDFRPAYDPLMAMSAALARTDPDDARVLRAEVEAARGAITQSSPHLHFAK